MKERGFTLIELLAVIVVLAIIAVIATPMVLNTIDEAKKGAAKASATTYIKEVEKQVAVSKLYEKNQILDGTYEIAELSIVKVKGTVPTTGMITIEKGNVGDARLCIDNYSIDYNGINYAISNNNYCKGEVILNIKDKELKQNISKKVDFDITGINIDDITNIACNNGAEVKVEGNHVFVSNALGETVCKMNKSLITAASELDNTKNYILMLQDEILTANVDFPKGSSVEITLNSHQLNLNGKYFRTYGDLIVNGDDNSKIVSTMQILNNSGSGILTVNNGNYERTAGAGTVVYNEGEGTIIINDGKFVNNGISTVVQNRIEGKPGGNININGGNFVAAYVVIYNQSSTGSININQTDKPISIVSLSQEWKPAINNGSTGSINLNGNVANECTSDYTKTTSGLCVYAEGDKNYTNETANTAIANVGDGIININGGTYFGGYMGISNHYNGIINISNGNISSGWVAVVNSRTATINICGANISSLKYDLYGSSNVTTGILNYSSNVKFTNGTNTPVTGGITENIIPNYTGVCISK